MEFLLHQRNQTRQRCFVAASPRQQHTRDVGKRCANSTPIPRVPRKRETVDSIATRPAHGAARGGARRTVVDSGTFTRQSPPAGPFAA
jgi:hypothetical protein